MIDFIGDVHGHADELEELLIKLGYAKKDNYYAHPDKRKVLFVGDYIDRGPKIRETLEIVKQMVDNDSAIALLGNHEYNALCFHAESSEGGHLRKHLIKNILQHYKTLEQFQNKQEEYEDYLEWFKTLPLFYETESFRAVHACWDYKSIDYLKKNLNNDRLTDDLIRQSVVEGTELYDAIENTLKGKEIPLPNGVRFLDADKNPRSKMRYRWWENLVGKTYKDICIHFFEGIPVTEVTVSDSEETNYYKSEDKPVFFGHYWLTDEDPSIFKNNICCLDYSVAEDGYLTAYRFDGELKLEDSKFIYVKEKCLA